MLRSDKMKLSVLYNCNLTDNLCC